jgi:hypothetical protein
MPEVTQQLFLGTNEVFAFYNDSWSGINSYEGFDSSAQAFINVTGISGSNAVAINNLVIALKSGSYWNSLDAIYPMIGGTATTHKYNLKNPQDTNAAYRLNFAGGWTHNSSGAKPDGVSGTYAETFAVTNTVFTTTNGHMSYYSFTNNAAATMVEMGANGPSVSGECNLALRFNDGNQYVFFAAAGGGVSSGATSAGFLINNRAANTEGWRNGTRVINAGNGVALTDRPLVLGAQNNNGVIERFSSRGCSFASFGKTLSSPAGFSTIVNLSITP